MKYSIEVLKHRLKEINKPIDPEDEDLIGAVLHQRESQDLVKAIQLLEKIETLFNLK